MSDVRYASYKGRTYRVAWQGETKYGPRTKLQFTSGAGEFWVSTNKVTEAAAPPAHDNAPTRRRRGKEWGRCWECGCEGWLDSDGYCGC